MNIPKKTRKKLYEAKGPLWIAWPEGTADPHPGKRYVVYSEEDGSRLFSVRVEKTKERGQKAKVKIDNDPVRVLPGLQGIRLEDGSYETEPERVSAEYESLLTREANQRSILLVTERRVEAERRSTERRLARAKEKGHEETVAHLERVNGG